MSMRSLEAEILAQAREVFNNRKLRQKDILEWSSGHIKPQAEEVVAKLPNGIRVAVAPEHDKRKPGSAP
jgi:hypothetical protein